jgi:hypothetical protein
MAGAGVNAADMLLARKSELAHAITEAMYREQPELLQRYGEQGRARCLEDMHYNIEHLAPAVALGEPQLFERYVVWLRDLLAARHVPLHDVQRSLELTIVVVREQLPEAEPEIARIVEAGLAALHG